MKNFTRIILALCLFASFQASAQLPGGSFAPDFTATDIDGNEHHLYDYLSQGYTVVIDVSATWCGPCWAYHTGAYNGTDGEGALHVLHNEHGVENGGSVIVLMIEGDGATTNDDLHGTGTNTQGDWVTDTPYPIIDSDAIANLYEITYFPTIYTICPTGFVTETSQITAADHWAFIEGADCQTVYQNDVAVIDYTGTENTCDDADLSINVVNTGSEDITSLNITVSGVTPAVDFDWSGTLGHFDMEEISLGNVTVNDGEDVVITVTNADDNMANNSITPPVGATVATTMIHIELQTDNYPGDYVVHVYNELGDEVLTAGPWAEFDVPLDPLFIEEDHWLPATGCYNVVLEDMFGDGLYDGAYCKVYGIAEFGVAMDNILDVGPSVFSSVEGSAEVNQVVSVNEMETAANFSVYPNPTESLINLNYTLAAAGEVKFQVVDMMGKVVMSQSVVRAAGNHTQVLDLDSLASGTFVLQINHTGQNGSVRVMVR
ncbi:MAG: T9SS type A sorting domain-containing protein [Flavobacteriales bacterium]|nr:T9SS type A sorting domain-containing protein [Flavobacteriales bacterium]